MRLRRPPGGRIRYSNFGVAVLGNALAARAGRSYESLLADRVTGPLGLQDTVVTLRPDQESRRAHGHKGRRRPTPDWSMPSLPGMGALHSTAADLARFVRAQVRPDDTPLGDAIRMTQEPRVGSGRMRSGLGWMITPVGTGPRRVHWHNGGTGGARSFAGFVRGSTVAVALLSNSRRGPEPLAFDVLNQLAG